MATNKPVRTDLLRIVAALAICFGALTIFSSGQGLLGSSAAGKITGSTAQIVQWFNLLAGLLFMVIGFGLLQRARWAVRLSVLVAVSSLCVLLVEAVNIGLGDAVEIRAVSTMVIRSLLWSVIAVVAWRTCQPERDE